jgi:hypothetical protein
LESGGKRSATPLSQAAVILRSIRQHHPQPKRRRASLAAALHNVPPRLRDSFVNGADFQIAKGAGKFGWRFRLIARCARVIAEML